MQSFPYLQSIPLLSVCLSRTVPHFFSVAYRQGLTLYNTLHTFCSDEPHGEWGVGGRRQRGMMSLPTNNNHPASLLSSLSPGCLATPQLSPLRALPPRPLAFCKPFAFSCHCNGSNHNARSSTLKWFPFFTSNARTHTHTHTPKCGTMTWMSPFPVFLLYMAKDWMDLFNLYIFGLKWELRLIFRFSLCVFCLKDE